MIAGAGTNLTMALAGARWQRLQQAAYRQAMLRAGQVAGGRSSARSAIDVIAEQSRRAALATLEGEQAADERSLLVAGTADAALGEVSGMLTEARSLMADSADTGASADERAGNQVQLDAILAGIDRIAHNTTFGDTRLLDGSATLQSGRQEQPIPSAATADLGAVESGGTRYALNDLKSGGALSLSTADPSAASIGSDVLDAAVEQVAQAREGIGNFVAHQIAPRLAAAQEAQEQLAGIASSSPLAGFDEAINALGGIRQDLLNRAASAWTGGAGWATGVLVDRMG